MFEDEMVQLLTPEGERVAHPTYESSLGVEEISAMYRDMVAGDAKLARGQVWCCKCGSTQMVNSGGALRNGWPKCCGETMTIDSPEERAAR